MNDPSRVRVTGPLGQYAAGFHGELEARGYSPGTAAVQLQLMAELSRWLVSEGVDVAGLTAVRVEQFFGIRRARVRTMLVSPKALRVLLEHLDGLGVLPKPEPVLFTPAEKLLERYDTYLLHERALGKRTAQRYVYVAGRFMSTCPVGGTADGSVVDAVAVTAFMATECVSCSAGWAKAVATALRSWLRFCFIEELIEVPLAHGVPTPAGWRAASLPKFLTPLELAALLGSCDRTTDAGRRDYAIMLIACRLGLRAAEIAGLGLDDIKWGLGELTARGKGRRVDRLPLPVDVGEAVADYVQHGRPAQPGGALFWRIGAPHGAMAPGTATSIVYRACDRAGLVRVGAHRLRHTAATQMLRGGASLPEIAQVLRHRSPNTTAIYAKVDRSSLRELALPWPGGAA